MDEFSKALEQEVNVAFKSLIRQQQFSRGWRARAIKACAESTTSLKAIKERNRFIREYRKILAEEIEPTPRQQDIKKRVQENKKRRIREERIRRGMNPNPSVDELLREFYIAYDRYAQDTYHRILRLTFGSVSSDRKG